MNRVDLCARFSEALSRSGITQSEMAAAAHVARSTVNRAVRGLIPPTFEMLEVLARHGVSAHWLLTGEDPAPPVHTGDPKVDRLCARVLGRGGAKAIARLRGYLEALDQELAEDDAGRRTA